MAKIKIELKEEHIKLIKNLKFDLKRDKDLTLDIYDPYGGNFLMEDLALILGKWDKAVKNTELDYDGRKFGLETETEMLELHSYIIENIEYIIDLILNFIDTGLKPGVYTAITNVLEWKYSEK